MGGFAEADVTGILAEGHDKGDGLLGGGNAGPPEMGPSHRTVSGVRVHVR